MREVEDSSVNLVVTSPPYWNVKDYGHPQQIGLYDTYHQFILKLNEVWCECYRVLKGGGRLCINVADIHTSAKRYGRSVVMPIHSDIIQFCVHVLGFNYMDTFVWVKGGVNIKGSGGASITLGSYPYPPNGCIRQRTEYILVFKKQGKRAIPPALKEASKLTLDEWKVFLDNVWQLQPVRQKSHCAMFPEDIPYRLVRLFSAVGDTVLDPFLGSGTTMKVCSELDRNCIGYEINEAFLPVIKEKVGFDKQRFQISCRRGYAA